MPHIIESLFIEILVEQRNIIIGVIYRPNTLPLGKTSSFLEEFKPIVDQIVTLNQPTYLLGDFNIDLLKCNTEAKNSEFLQIMLSHGFLPTITKPTRIQSPTATLIDQVFARFGSRTVDFVSGIMLTDISDHFGVFLCLKHANAKQCNRLIVKRRNYDDDNVKTFLRLLSEANFQPVFQNNNPEWAYDYFLDHFLTLFNFCFPEETVRIPKRYIRKNPWMTKGLVISSNTKNMLYKAKLRDSANNLEPYKNYCRVYNKILRAAKKSYYYSKFAYFRNDLKNTWKIISDALQTKRNPPGIPDNFNLGDITITDKKKIVDEFNRFFCDTGKRIEEEIPAETRGHASNMETRCQSCFFMEPVIANEIETACKTLKNKESCGFDGITNTLVKKCIHLISSPLAHIFSLSITNGCVPLKLKIAKVTPIYKSGNMNNFNNYRPISLLPVFSKLLEKIMYKRMTKFLDKHKLLYDHQYGFRSGFNTDQPVLQLLKSVADANDKPTKDLTLAVFLDLSKAFDSVSHEILLRKLQGYGFRGVVNDWFRSYLTNRTQYVEIKFKDTSETVSETGANGGSISYTSNNLTLQCGVPQGSILGPLLFLIYVNDLHLATSLPVLSYADDTTIYYSHSNLSVLYNTINTELEKIYKWLCSNRLLLNINKTKFIVFGPRNSERCGDNLSIKIRQQNVVRVAKNTEEQAVKFLGIYLDESLTWECHIKHIQKKLNCAIYFLARLKNFMPHKQLKMIYYAIFHSHLNYGLMFWGSSKFRKKLEILQKKALRIICNRNFNSHTNPLFHKTKILKLEDMYDIRIASFMFDYKWENLPSSFSGFFQHRQCSYGTRSQTQMPRTFARTNFTENLPKHIYPKIWNKHQITATGCKTKWSFISKLKVSCFKFYKLLTIVCSNPRCPDCCPAT